MSLGIGRATALLFAKEGCLKLAIADLNGNALMATKKEINERYGQKVDVLAVSTGEC